MVAYAGEPRMNICYISSIDISLPNGPGVNEREFVNILHIESRRRGDRLCCLIPRPSGNMDIPLDNVVMYPAETAGATRSYRRFFFNFLRLMRFFMGLMPFRPDTLFVLRLSPETLLVPLVLRFLGRPYYIKTLEDIYGLAGGAFSGLTRLNYVVKRFLLGMILPGAVCIDACTHQLVNSYKHLFGLDNIFFINNAVNVQRFDIRNRTESRRRCGLDSFNKIAGYCGGFPSQRGAAQLIEIAEGLISKVPDCGILIVGDDAQLEALKLRVRKRGLERKVIFKGVVPYAQLADYINCLDVGIALDTSDKVNNVGNSSQKIRQYLACGVPVICPQNTNQDIIVQGLAVPVSVNDPAAILDAVSAYFGMESSDTRQYRKKARRYAVEVLSTDAAYEKRYRFWKNAIE